MMELSYYTVLVDRGDRVIAYSTLTQALVELTAEEAGWLEHADSCPDTALVEALAQARIIVESAESQADELLVAQHRARFNTSFLDLTITLGRMCNFECDYCYVPKRAGVMDEATQDAVVAFVKDIYEHNPFGELRVNWYGGEPLLYVDEMERLSAQLMEFCEQRSIDYLGHILSNASLADARTCKRLRENCGIVSIMPTLSGYGDMQDWQRPASNGKKYFSTIMENIGNMVDAGIVVHVNYVTNFNNIEECTQLASELSHCRGVRTRLSMTGPFGKGRIVLRDGKDTPIRLFTGEEFAPYCVEFHRRLGLDAQGYRKALKPIHLYCAAYMDQGYFIDETGDVTVCMVDMDYPERALFNVNDWTRGQAKVSLDRVLAYAAFDPIKDKECRRCRILPLCQGGCAEKYLASGKLACHKFKWCIEGLVSDYYEALMREQDGGSGLRGGADGAVGNGADGAT